MLFDKKIKYLVEVLKKPKPDISALASIGKTMSGYQHVSPSRGLSVGNENMDVTNALIKFQKSRDPKLLSDAIVFADKNPELKMNFDGKTIRGKDLKNKIVKKYFTAGKSDYIDYPKDENGLVLNSNAFKRAVLKDKKYNILRNDPSMWIKLLFKLRPINPSDRRQDSRSEDVIFHYFYTPTGMVKSARVKVINGFITPTPFAGRFTYNNRYKAYTSNGDFITYDQIKGGISLEDFKKILETDKAEAKLKTKKGNI